MTAPAFSSASSSITGPCTKPISLSTSVCWLGRIWYHMTGQLDLKSTSSKTKKIFAAPESSKTKKIFAASNEMSLEFVQPMF